jgi:hypothetical protein
MLGPRVGALRGGESAGEFQAPVMSAERNRQLAADGCRDVADVYERTVLPRRLPL